ncbi:probable pyridoxal 5'-phosphate synthase subunit pdx2 [Lepeophtheirus salmonis]|uniref:probable pyridoxal 5'-phosphate synthase subunit pdx2 n=1 Tax=Lepeophtheirus salmonis TaxID=72036 RepID=UPI001AEAAA28|nr:probable pyridoxal 5'-phosphate synthase subunit pdx2 [Lepeophtheirus salmonis]XP_040570344.1 probable pyridoxal 5'-phosphate synthase subunit pdx2 [Lepeophtheirus salmonis]
MGGKKLQIGVLAVQGSFEEHVKALNQVSNVSNRYDIHVFEIRCKDDITENMEGLIIPGGESTTLSVFFKDQEFFEKIKVWINNEKHFVWGTCMGMILLSDEITDQKVGGQIQIGGIKIKVARNYFGRQAQSFETKLSLTSKDFPSVDSFPDFHGIFIRAPGVISLLDDSKVQILANLRNSQTGEKEIVAVRQGRLLACSFHPELTKDYRFHQYFVDIIATREI